MKKSVEFICLLVLLSLPIASADSRNSNLTFDQRVEFQKAIEEVYWKHTIWPVENPGPKPELRIVMPDSAIRKKTQEYIRQSNALDSYRDRRITPRRIQAEMNRMARETKDPELLSQLWAALNNDPYVIAECFARPALVERYNQIKQGNVRSQQFSSDRIAASVSYNYKLPRIKGTFFGAVSGAAATAANTWSPTSTLNAPRARAFHSAVWTGSYMIIWGGYSGYNDGKKYNPATNAWSAISGTGAPSGRYSHTAIWTGTQMIVWGGRQSNGTYTNSGGRYTLSSNSWSPTAISGTTPRQRANHTAIWTGSQMIIWGGADATTQANGARYNPTTNAWTAISNAGPTPRFIHTAVVPGALNQMIIWGGSISTDGGAPVNTGGRYIFSSNSWISTTPSGAPTPRFGHSAVWSGQMIVWGGKGSQNVVTNTGGRYTVSTNSWTPTSIIGAPSARFRHSAVWTGLQMIVWGGANASVTVNTGARYLPGSNSWLAMSTTGQPTPRYAHTAIWTGSKMLVWGGNTSITSLISTNTGGIYTP